jgi:WD40 repeat protein
MDRPSGLDEKKPKFILPCLLPLSAAGSADGTSLMVGSPSQIKIWETQEYKLQDTIPYEAGAVKMAANPTQADQFAVVSAPANPISLWSIKDAKRTAELGTKDKNNKINSVAINAAGTRLLDGNNDICENWDIQTQHKLQVVPRAGTVVDAQWNPVMPDGIATCSVREGAQPLSIVFLWDQRQSSDPVGECTLPIGVNIMRYNNQGTQIICSSPGQYAVIDVKKMALLEYLSIDGKQKSKTPLHPAPGKTHNVDSMLVPSTATDLFLAGIDDGNVITADLASPAQSRYFQANANPDAIYGLVLNTHNHTLATTLMGAGFVKIWDVSQLQEKLEQRKKELEEKRTRICDLL